MTQARIKWISGPVLHAKCQSQFHTHEAVHVGKQELLGEVISIEKDIIVVQVYENTAGLRPGDKIIGTGQLLSVLLGPHLLGHIFDGLLRPLATAQTFIAPGMGIRSSQEYFFKPLCHKGDILEAGQIIGSINLPFTDAFPIRVPPNLCGTLESIVDAGNYTLEDSIGELRLDKQTLTNLQIAHRWPVRLPRPIKSRLAINEPLLTGQRILDTLFPLVRGSKAAMPGGFGTGKTVLQESLAKWCNADVIIYVGCGERGNEMAGVLKEFPKLVDPRSNRPLMERTIIIANTSNMPVAAREASIYTAVTVAEYFRDQGLHVALMADSISRWAEALREISGRLGELPGEAAYPAYLSSRLAEFYERAARVETLSGDDASVSIIAAVSPPSGDFSEPVTSHTKRFVRCFWALDPQLAQARFFPAINPLNSYSDHVEELGKWWIKQSYHEWSIHRRRLLGYLQQQARLERMARIIGKDALPPSQQLSLLCAELINDGFLRQSSFSQTDASCSPERQAAMMDCLFHFFDLAEKALQQGLAIEAIEELDMLRTLRRMGEEFSDEQLTELHQFQKQMDGVFNNLMGALHES